MSVKKFKKKPVVIEAIQYTGANAEDVIRFSKDVIVKPGGKSDVLIIRTLEGDMQAQTGDFIIKGVNGEFYPCKPDIFEKTYEEVVE